MNNLLGNIISKTKSTALVALAFIMLILSGCGALEEEVLDSIVNPVLNEASKQIDETVNDATAQLQESINQVTDELQNITAGENSSEADSSSNEQLNENQPITSFEQVAQYLREHQQLPPNYITKEEASELGWVAAEGNLHIVAPGKSIGGDRFGNREGLLPNAEGRVWYEADIDYESGTRNAKRIVFSNDGLIYMTTDHYASFTDITEEGRETLE